MAHYPLEIQLTCLKGIIIRVNADVVLTHGTLHVQKSHEMESKQVSGKISEVKYFNLAI